jgi:ferric-dicitrate binding protein FerR (iron transport regulator)
MRPEPFALSPRADCLVGLAKTSLGRLSEEQRLAGLTSLRIRLHDYHRAKRARRIARIVGGLFALTLAGALWARHRSAEGAALAVRAVNGEIGTDGAMEATVAPRPELRFSDASEIPLAVGTRLRVRSLDARGARVSVERGELHARVSPAQQARWVFDAGPYAVDIAGSTFTLSWHEDTQRLDLEVASGSVHVTGAEPAASVPVRAGQWLTVKDGEVRIRPIDSRDAPDGDGSADESVDIAGR